MAMRTGMALLAVCLSGAAAEAADLDAKTKAELLAVRDSAWYAWFGNDQAKLKELLPPDAVTISAGDPTWHDLAGVLQSAADFATTGSKLTRLAFPRTESRPTATPRSSTRSTSSTWRARRANGPPPGAPPRSSSARTGGGSIPAGTWTRAGRPRQPPFVSPPSRRGAAAAPALPDAARRVEATRAASVPVHARRPATNERRQAVASASSGMASWTSTLRVRASST